MTKSKYHTIPSILLIVLLPIYLYLRTIPIPKNSLTNTFFEKEFRIAHRCGKAILPENTLYACKEIFQKDLADILEMDVHLTKDFHLVVIHDASVDRTTNGRGKVAELDYADIRKLDAGYLFTEDKKTFPYRNKGITILDLEEFFRELPTANFYIEVKVKDPLAAEILVKLIQKYRMQDKVIIGSASDSVNENLRLLSDSKIQIFSGILATGGWYLAYLFDVRGIVNLPKVMAIPDLPHLLPVSNEFINAVKEQNIKVHIFTVNDEKQIQRYKSLGLDGVMTDNPYFFKNLL